MFETAHVQTKVKARIDRFELSGHADRDELLQFAVQTGAAQHRPHARRPRGPRWFAQQLALAAPATKVLDPVPGQEYLV